MEIGLAIAWFLFVRTEKETVTSFYAFSTAGLHIHQRFIFPSNKGISKKNTKMEQQTVENLKYVLYLSIMWE